MLSRMPRDASDEVTALYEQALALRSAHALAPAQEIVARLLVRLRRGGAGPVDVARVLQLRGALADDAGDARAALRSFAAAARLVAPLRRDPDAARLRVQIACAAAWVRVGRGEYDQARALYTAALRLARRRLGPVDDDTIAALNGLGVVGKYTGRFRSAEHYYDLALRALRGRRGRADAMTLATLYHNLGGLEHARGRPGRGEPHARRSVELRERALGPDHPAVAADVAALAALLDAQDRFDEAEALYRRALAIFRRVYGREHYELCVTYNNLGAVAHRRGRPRGAERLYRRALAMKEKLLGAGHPDVALTLSNLGALYVESGRVAEAAAAYRRALAIFRRHLPGDHPHLRACLEAQALLRG